jgi:RNA polymerase sigma-70 factor (ECF subfamily)
LIKTFTSQSGGLADVNGLIAADLEPGVRVVASRHVTVPPDLESAVAPQPADPADRVDPADLAGLFDRHGAELLRYCARRVGPDHAEDVVAETFLTAHANFRSYDPSRSGPLPWLYGIATNLLRRHGREEVQALRAFARAGREAQRGSEDWDRAAERVDAYRARHRLAKALASLSRKQRDVLLLFAVAQLEYEEIAVALGIPVGTVRSTLHRARAKVRVALSQVRGGDQ